MCFGSIAGLHIFECVLALLLAFTYLNVFWLYCWPILLGSFSGLLLLLVDTEWIIEWGLNIVLTQQGLLLQVYIV